LKCTLYNCYNLSSIKDLSHAYPTNVLNDLSETTFITNGDYIFVKEYDRYVLVDYVGHDINLILPSDINGYSYDIGNYAFISDNIRSITIPEGVQNIRTFAMTNTNLEELYLPSTLKTISGVNSNIDKVYFNGNIREYYKINLINNPFNSNTHNLYVKNSYSEYIRYMGK
jgi:hypothetical protein